VRVVEGERVFLEPVEAGEVEEGELLDLRS
jgi:hypothetical protein